MKIILICCFIKCLLQQLFLHLPDLLSVGSFSLSFSSKTIIWLLPKFRTETPTEQFCLPELLLTILLFDPSSSLIFFCVEILSPAGQRILCVLLLSLHISGVSGFSSVKHDGLFFPLFSQTLLDFTVRRTEKVSACCSRYYCL